MKRRTGVVTFCSAALILAACGGGSSGSNTSSTLQGKVIDGYIANATVCLDLNKNLNCDPDEPSTTSDATGSFSFVVGGDISNHILLAEVFSQAKDQDDGGATIDGAERSEFTLATPATQSSVISPLTTLVTLELLSDLANPISTVLIASAESAVKARLGLTTNFMGIDFIAAGNSTLHQLARVISASISGVDGMSLKSQEVINQTVSDPTQRNQTNHKATKEGMYAVLSTVVNTADASLKYTLANAQKNALIATMYLNTSGDGLLTTLVLSPPDRTYFDNNPTFFPDRCPDNLDNLGCMIHQDFIRDAL